MSSLTNVNNNSSVVVVGRTAPVPPGQQTADKSLPVVVASDQPAIPVEEQNKIASEVALSLLGVPRSEVALGIFADVNTYDVNPTEWSATPEQKEGFAPQDSPAYTGFNGQQDHGLTHVPEESGALIEAPADKTAVLTSKRFFRYQPGRVSSATFGVKSSLTPDSATVQYVRNPAIRKYGIYDNFDGYYWETRGNGEGDQFCVVRRTQSLVRENPIEFSTSGQQDDYGLTGDPSSETPGDLVILRDGLIMSHAAMYDPTMLKEETYYTFQSVDTTGNTITLDSVADLNVGQHVIYEADGTADSIGLTNTRIYKILSISGTDVTLSEIDDDAVISIASTITSGDNHYIKTPVPFVFPDTANTTGAEDVMFPLSRTFLQQRDPSTGELSFTDLTIPIGAISTQQPSFYPSDIKDDIDAVNSGVRAADLGGATHDVSGWANWIEWNVDPEYYKVYEFRVPRSRFSGDFIDGSTSREVLYSDVVRTSAGQNTVKYPGQNVKSEADPNANLIRDSIWNIDFTKVMMKKIEFSWYGAVGALFLAYVPVSNGEARWVRIHHLRASNQLKVASLGNATLPITYTVYGGGSEQKYGYLNSERTPNSVPGSGSFSEYISKYGASYYIDGGDRGTVRLHSHSTDTATDVYGSKYRLLVNASNSQAQDPYLIVDSTGVYANNPDVSDFYIQGTVITGDPVDSGVRVAWVDAENNRIYLNKPLSSITGTAEQIDVIVDRPTINFGVQTKTEITSSQGFDVRNRVQVYPTRLSTGVTGQGTSSLQLLKNPTFQSYAIDNWSKDTSGYFDPLTLSSDTSLNDAGTPTPLSVTTEPTGLSSGDRIYGWFRGYFTEDPATTLFPVFGFLTYTDSGIYTFTSQDPFNGAVTLEADFSFLPAQNFTSDGTVIDSSSATSTFEIERLSSILIRPELRTPIPGTGTQITTFFVGSGGQQFDLLPYFDYNKDYLSYPLTNRADTLFVTSSSVDRYYGLDSVGDPDGIEVLQSSILSSLTWEEQ
jgi:hypothetical protein